MYRNIFYIGTALAAIVAMVKGQCQSNCFCAVPVPQPEEPQPQPPQPQPINPLNAAATDTPTTQPPQQPNVIIIRGPYFPRICFPGVSFPDLRVPLPAFPTIANPADFTFPTFPPLPPFPSLAPFPAPAPAPRPSPAPVVPRAAAADDDGDDDVPPPQNIPCNFPPVQWVPLQEYCASNPPPIIPNPNQAAADDDCNSPSPQAPSCNENLIEALLSAINEHRDDCNNGIEDPSDSS